MDDQALIFRELIESALDAIGITDVDGNIIYANPAFGRLTGLGDQAVGTQILSYFDAESKALVSDQIIPSVIESGRWQGTLELRRPNNEVWLAQISASRISDSQGVDRYGLILRDISERQKRIRDLRHAKERLELSLESSPLATMEMDRDGTILSWNPKAARIFGWSEAEALGQNALELLVPNLAREQVEAIIAQIIQGMNNQSLNQNVTKDGTVIICQWYNTYLRDEHGAVSGWISQVADVTDQLEAAESINEKQRRFDRLIGNLPGMVYRCINTPKWPMEFVSPGSLGTIGYPPERFMAQGDQLPEIFFGDLIIPEDQAHVWDVVQKAINDHEPYELHYRIYDADGRLRWMWEQGNPIFDRHNQLIALEGYILDISEQQQAERERNEFQEQLIAAQQATLRELGTPIIPIADEVIAMPLIGSIDTRRAQQVIETLLEGVAEHQAAIAILDITGVPIVDTQVANALLRAAKAVRLLGTEVLLTGVRAEVAQTLISLGVDLGEIRALASLQAGIAYALAAEH